MTIRFHIWHQAPVKKINASFFFFSRTEHGCITEIVVVVANLSILRQNNCQQIFLSSSSSNLAWGKVLLSPIYTWYFNFQAYFVTLRSNQKSRDKKSISWAEEIAKKSFTRDLHRWGNNECEAFLFILQLFFQILF